MGARASIPNNSARQVEHVFIPNQLAASTTRHLGATSITSAVVGTVIAATTEFNPNVGGRNVVLTQVEASGSALSATYDVHGYDQFNNPIVERTTSIASSATWTGTKIFQRVTKLVVVAIAGAAASDTIAIGDGNKVGIPRLFSADLSEIVGASLIVAAGTTVTGKTVNTTNFDTTYKALNAAFFASSTVAAGDSVALLFRNKWDTPDDLSAFPARS